MGEEFWGKGTNIQEGPGVNMARIMHCGRNMEYMSGEDGVLGSKMLPPVVDGIQQNVMAIVKHYIANTQETDRSGVNEIVDEKLLMEMYGAPFEAAVQGVGSRQAAGVMCEWCVLCYLLGVCFLLFSLSPLSPSFFSPFLYPTFPPFSLPRFIQPCKRGLGL